MMRSCIHGSVLTYPCRICIHGNTFVCPRYCVISRQVEQDTAQSMQMLLELDNIKSRMKDASDALRVSVAF